MKQIKILSLILLMSTISMEAFSSIENSSVKEKSTETTINMEKEIEDKEKVATELAEEIVEKMENRRALFNRRGDKSF